MEYSPHIASRIVFDALIGSARLLHTGRAASQLVELGLKEGDGVRRAQEPRRHVLHELAATVTHTHPLLPQGASPHLRAISSSQPTCAPMAAAECDAPAPSAPQARANGATRGSSTPRGVRSGRSAHRCRCSYKTCACCAVGRIPYADDGHGGPGEEHPARAAAHLLQAAICGHERLHEAAHKELWMGHVRMHLLSQATAAPMASGAQRMRSDAQTYASRES